MTQLPPCHVGTVAGQVMLWHAKTRHSTPRVVEEVENTFA
jgi:hypothetical protein